MATRDNFNLLKTENSLAQAVLTSDTLSSAIDMAGFESLVVVAQIGAHGDTLSGTDKIELELVECDTESGSYTQVATSDLLGGVTGTNTGCFAVIDDNSKAASAYKVGYIGSKEFVKVNVNFSGTHTNGTSVGALAVKGHAHINPVS